MEFANAWLGIIFAGFGLLLIILEMAGLQTEFVLIIIGAIFAICGLATWPFHNWIVTVAVICVFTAFYVTVGHSYVQRRWLTRKTEKTNIDTIIGKRALVQKAITSYEVGQVKVGYEQWRARADEDIAEGEQVEVVDLHGITLTVKRIDGGD